MLPLITACPIEGGSGTNFCPVLRPLEFGFPNRDNRALRLAMLKFTVLPPSRKQGLSVRAAEVSPPVHAGWLHPL